MGCDHDPILLFYERRPTQVHSVHEVDLLRVATMDVNGYPWVHYSMIPIPPRWINMIHVPAPYPFGYRLYG